MNDATRAVIRQEIADRRVYIANTNRRIMYLNDELMVEKNKLTDLTFSINELEGRMEEPDD